MPFGHRRFVGLVIHNGHYVAHFHPLDLGLGSEFVPEETLRAEVASNTDACDAEERLALKAFDLQHKNRGFGRQRAEAAIERAKYAAVFADPLDTSARAVIERIGTALRASIVSTGDPARSNGVRISTATCSNFSTATSQNRRLERTSMRVIWKLKLDPSIVRYPLPLGAVPVSVQMQQGCPHLWALVDPGAPMVERVIHIRATGETFDNPYDTYVGTFQQPEHGLVWHVFDGGVYR